ncbi:hypothetical protein ASPFODRAFT_47633 [Aspergillus luchuensis CBS 106.47]|uniref:Uncharacterized protein n=1 Tax=Aspergillus luchuensis (strain CBS 106.47) TaxID=1137211 RepID=A0A1M3TEB0_ASPLC|nr:hypothetical protein ASPFODRAFT_47633 [Aspergillus luchuensis CBS 106.47]
MLSSSITAISHWCFKDREPDRHGTNKIKKKLPIRLKDTIRDHLTAKTRSNTRSG